MLDRHTPLPSEAMRAGRRALDGLGEVRILSDYRWHSDAQAWGLKLCIDTGLPPTPHIPNPSNWFIFVDSAYPRGKIAVYPSAIDGITTTFPHQEYNAAPGRNQTWCPGKLCLDMPGKFFGRHGHNPEPQDDHSRLAWHIERAIAWIRAAATGKLITTDDPFELPHFPHKSGEMWTLAYQEGPETYAWWRANASIAGLATLLPVANRDNLLAISQFLDFQGRTLLEYSWGPAVGGHRSKQRWAAWVRIPIIPVFEPWTPPIDWKQLTKILSLSGISFDDLTEKIAQYGRPHQVEFLMIGFPVPRFINHEPIQLAWQGIWISRMALDNPIPNGFRRNKCGFHQRDRTITFTPSKPLAWQPTKNWHTEVLEARGCHDKALTERHTALIGGGAVGSLLAENLVRGGLYNLLIMDADQLEAGNLIRHTLTLGDVSLPKAETLAAHLNQISPYASVTYKNIALQCDNSSLALLDNRDLIIECTAENSVLQTLASQAWSEEKLFISISVGWHAQRLYFFYARGRSFPIEAFEEAYEPWSKMEVSLEENGPILDALGCWHPLFPARYNRLAMLAASAVHLLERASSTLGMAYSLKVLEILEDEQRLTLRPANLP